jgi:adenylate kinase
MYDVFQGGDLIREGRGIAEADRDLLARLPKDDILANQILIALGFQRVRNVDSADMLFDGHSVVSNGRNLVRIPASIINGLAPKGIIFVSDVPEAIAGRRMIDTSRSRVSGDLDQIELEQTIALETANSYAVELSLPLHEVKSGDFSRLTAAISDLLSG